MHHLKRKKKDDKAATLVIIHNSKKVTHHIKKMINDNQNELTFTSLLPIKVQYSPVNGKRTIFFINLANIKETTWNLRVVSKDVLEVP